jgi:hypothetical protein
MNAQASDPTELDRARSTSIGALLMAAFGTCMIALAIGALWLVLYLAFPRLHAETWLALPLGLLLGPLIRGWIIDAPWPAAVLATLAMLLAAAYMRVLLVASDLAGSFGMGFMQALRHAGAGMLVHLSWLSLDPDDMAVYALAAALAGTLAWRMRPRPKGSRSG